MEIKEVRREEGKTRETVEVGDIFKIYASSEGEYLYRMIIEQNDGTYNAICLAPKDEYIYTPAYVVNLDSIQELYETTVDCWGRVEIIKNKDIELLIKL